VSFPHGRPDTPPPIFSTGLCSIMNETPVCSADIHLHLRPKLRWIRDLDRRCGLKL